MNLIVSRHGNTFAPGDRVVWTGSTNDLPLVPKGIAQAEQFADVLLSKQVKVAAIYCGPLQRTRKYAEIITRKLGLPQAPMVDLRMTEVDYGEWTGLTQEEVIARFGESELQRWNEQSLWPSSGNWGGSEQKVIEEVQSFVQDLLSRHSSDDTVIVVSSNGRLRYFLTLIEGELEKRKKTGAFKVQTGHVCRIVFKNFRAQSLGSTDWNVSPENLTL